MCCSYWVSVLLCILLFPVIRGQSCFGLETYEKIVSTKFTPVRVSPFKLEHGGQEAPVKHCIGICKESAACLSFTLDFEQNTCYSFNVNTLGSKDSLHTSTTTIFFEKVCFSTKDLNRPFQNCGAEKWWAFEVEREAFLIGHVDKEIPGVGSRYECEKYCLKEDAFLCRSADYDENKRICRLSKEDKRTQSEDFVRGQTGSGRFYIENQCAIAAPTSCRFQNQDNVKFLSADLVKFAENADECRNQCELELQFNCKSYTYSNNKCSLSSDGTDTLGFDAMKQEAGNVFGEKKCIVDRCEGGVITFEKTTGYVLRSALETEIPVVKSSSMLLQGITMDCWKQCKDSKDCPAFTVTYRNQVCQKSDRNSQGRIGDLTPRAGANYFERVCLRGTEALACQNKAWSFERVPGYQLEDALYETHIPNVQNRSECEQYCLRERMFTCRSAFYHEDDLDCKLTRDDRRTQPQKYRANNNIRTSYLENSCIPALTMCPYEEILEHYPTYTDAVIQGSIKSHLDCEKLCDNNQDFSCRSYAYYSAQGQCFLSGDDSISFGEIRNGLRSRPGIAYYERNCSHGVVMDTTPTWAPTTPTPTSPYLPKTLCGIGMKLIYEKIIGHEAYGSFPIFLHRGNYKNPGITLECIKKCEVATDCESFVLDYQRNECYALKKRTNIQIRESPSKTYFKSMCVSVGVTCSKLWAVDIMIDRELLVSRPMDIILHVTREECARRCLEDRRFKCKSANYYSFRRECALLAEDRDSSIADLHFSAGIDFIENQCNVETFACPYRTPELGVYMWHSDRTIYGIDTSIQCEQECDRESSFNCRSFTHVDGTGEFTCLLSSDSRETVPTIAFELRPKSLYVQKDCRNLLTRSVPRETPYPTPPVVTPTTTTPSYCSFDRYSYEKVVGYEPRLLRRERIVTHDSVGALGQCEHECKKMGDRCKGFVVIYTPIQSCYWLEVAASELQNSLLPAALAAYYEKVCLKGPTCTKFWVFERVLGQEFDWTPIMDVPSVFEREHCEDLCLQEKDCLSANYYYRLRMCRLFSENRRTQPGNLRENEHVDYLENHCVSDRPTCQYRDYPDRFFPYIDRLTIADSLHECQRRCDIERKFPCRSVNYETVTRHCALCGEEMATMTEASDLLQFRRNSVYSEKGNCEQVSVECNQQDMTLSFNFATPFNGRIYAKGNPAECYMLGTGQRSLQFAISMGTHCGTKLEGPDLYMNEVVVQGHPVIMTDNDKTIRVICSFEARERTYTLGNPLDADNPAMEVATLFQHPIKSVVTNTVPPPNVVMRVLDQQGRDARRVGLGDELILRIEMRDPHSVFALQAKNLYARSTNGESMFLIDASGCPNDPSIFPALQLDPVDGRSIYANFKAFRFPSTGMVNFEVQIKFCQDRCLPVLCRNGGRSYGRRRRQIMNAEKSSEKEITRKLLPLPLSQKLSTTKSTRVSSTTPKTEGNFTSLEPISLTTKNSSISSVTKSPIRLRIEDPLRDSSYHKHFEQSKEQSPLIEQNTTSTTNETSEKYTRHSGSRKYDPKIRTFKPLPPRELTPDEFSSLRIPPPNGPRNQPTNRDWRDHSGWQQRPYYSSHSSHNPPLSHHMHSGPHTANSPIEEDRLHSASYPRQRPSDPHTVHVVDHRPSSWHHQLGTHIDHQSNSNPNNLHSPSHPLNSQFGPQDPSHNNFPDRNRLSYSNSYNRYPSHFGQSDPNSYPHSYINGHHNKPSLKPQPSNPHSLLNPNYSPFNSNSNLHASIDHNRPPSQSLPFNPQMPLRHDYPQPNGYYHPDHQLAPNHSHPSLEKYPPLPNNHDGDHNSPSLSFPFLPTRPHPPHNFQHSHFNGPHPFSSFNNPQSPEHNSKHSISFRVDSSQNESIHNVLNDNNRTSHQFPRPNSEAEGSHKTAEENDNHVTKSKNDPWISSEIDLKWPPRPQPPPHDSNSKWNPRPLPLDPPTHIREGKQSSIPDELPLSLAIMVGEDKPSPRWSLERRTTPPPTTASEITEETICTSKTTVVATVTAVTVLYVVGAASVVISYRWRRSKKRKSRILTDPTPLPLPQPTSSRPDVTYRSIYGV